MPTPQSQPATASPLGADTIDWDAIDPLDPRLAIRRHTDRCFHRVEEWAPEGFIVQGVLFGADEVAEVIGLDAAGAPLPKCGVGDADDAASNASAAADASAAATDRPAALDSVQSFREAIERFDPPGDRGTVAAIVARPTTDTRHSLDAAVLTPEQGVPGDAWGKRKRSSRGRQISVIRADFARLIARGQPLGLSGDNLVLDLDLSVDNLPIGSELRVGDALLRVTPKPHLGCDKFRERFGDAALAITGTDHGRRLRLRGLFCEVIDAGRVAVGDGVVVVRRGVGDG